MFAEVGGEEGDAKGAARMERSRGRQECGLIVYTCTVNE